MGFDPLSIAIATSALTAGTSFAQASAQNSATKKAAAVEKEQNRISANERRTALAKQLQEFSGTLRTTSAARGTAGAASSSALNLSSISTANQSKKNIDLQQLFGNASTDARANANFQNPFLSGFGGAVSGFSTGLSIGNNL